MNYKVLAEGPIQRLVGRSPSRVVLLLVGETEFWVTTQRINDEGVSNDNIEVFSSEDGRAAYDEAMKAWLKRVRSFKGTYPQVVNERTLPLYKTIDG